MAYLTVRQAAEKLGKNEETIKRWLRAGKYPNAYKSNDKEGWKIPESDFNYSPSAPVNEQTALDLSPSMVTYLQDEKEIVVLAYQIATLTYPTNSEIELLLSVNMKRRLEILLVFRQSTSKIKNPLGFIKQAIHEGWTPATLPQKLNRKRTAIEEKMRDMANTQEITFPFYNWLEGEED